MVFLGFSPLSAFNTGWCIVETIRCSKTSELHSGESTDVSSALAVVSELLSQTPDTIGIAAPLYWTPKDDREADRILRGMVLSLGGKSATVPALPATTGARITGGIMLAAQSHQRWPETTITEAATDALLIMDSGAREFVSTLSIDGEAEKQAALAAYTARALCEHRPGWQDLRSFDKESFEPVSGLGAAFWSPARKC